MGSKKRQKETGLGKLGVYVPTKGKCWNGFQGLEKLQQGSLSKTRVEASDKHPVSILKGIQGKVLPGVVSSLMLFLEITLFSPREA